MMKSMVGSRMFFALFGVSLSVLSAGVSARELPDFTVLAENNGPAVAIALAEGPCFKANSAAGLEGSQLIR